MQEVLPSQIEARPGWGSVFHIGSELAAGWGGGNIPVPEEIKTEDKKV